MSHPPSLVGTTIRAPSSTTTARRRAHIYLPPQTITAESMMPPPGISPSRKPPGRPLSPTVAFPRSSSLPQATTTTTTTTTTTRTTTPIPHASISYVPSPAPPPKRPHTLSLIRLSAKVAHAVAPSRPILRSSPKVPSKLKSKMNASGPKLNNMYFGSSPRPTPRVVRRSLAAHVFEPEGSSGPDTDVDVDVDAEPDLEDKPRVGRHYASSELDSDDDGTLVSISAGPEGDLSPPWSTHKHLPKLPKMAIVSEVEEVEMTTPPPPLSTGLPLPPSEPQPSVRERQMLREEEVSFPSPVPSLPIVTPFSAGVSRKIIQHIWDEPMSPTDTGSHNDAFERGLSAHLSAGAYSTDDDCESICPRWLLHGPYPPMPDFVIEVEDRAIVYYTSLTPPPWHYRRRKGGQKSAGGGERDAGNADLSSSVSESLLEPAGIALGGIEQHVVPVPIMAI